VDSLKEQGIRLTMYVQATRTREIPTQQQRGQKAGSVPHQETHIDRHQCGETHR